MVNILLAERDSWNVIIKALRSYSDTSSETTELVLTYLVSLRHHADQIY